MDEKMIVKEDGMGVDLQRLLSTLLKKSWLVMLISLLCVAVTLLGTFFLVTPKYEASTKFYVNNSAQTSSSMSSSDLATSRNLVESYLVILETRETLEEVIACAGIDESPEDLWKRLSASAVNGTEIFEVVVTSSKPEKAAKIADAIAQVLPARIVSIIEGTSAKVVEGALLPTKPSSPNYVTNTIIGFIFGFVLAVGMIIIREIFDVSVRTDEDIARVCGYPILASVPDMAEPDKSGFAFPFGTKKKGKKKAGHVGQRKETAFVGANVNFAAAEAYKLLRTKLQFSFSDENESHVIGVSSALSGEGKSLSSVNLAYSLAQLNKRVILVDCDMRRPTLAEKLKIKKAPGLSSLLTGQSGMMDVIQRREFNHGEYMFHVISAGTNPPNPIELLSSKRMEKMLESLRKGFDYIILDLPPVCEVSDAMSVADKTDGMLLVVRQDHCNRMVLADALRQFEFVDTKILGVVFNCNNEPSGKGYYKRYGASYEHNDRKIVVPGKE